MKKNLTAVAVIFGLALWIAGCSTSKPGAALSKDEAPKALDKANELYDQGRYTDAMLKCIDIGAADPLLPGLPDLQNKIMTKLNEERTRATALQASTTVPRAIEDLDSKKVIPYSFGIRRGINGETNALRTSTSSMQEALKKKVTVHMDSVDLNAFIMQIGASEGINIIADAAASDGGGSGKKDDIKTMTLHAQGVPLSEILDFVSRNLGVSFFVGENLIWVTPRKSTPTIPLFTKLYRLRKGLSSDEVEKDDTKINIMKAIDKFIPKEDGAEILFDRKAHLLIVKNTRDNIARIEDLIEALDVCPPQVVIEARFVNTSISDLRELGIDWLLDSPATISRQNILNNGVGATVAASQINAGASIANGPQSMNQNSGQNFAQNTNLKGLNFTYQGILTDPMFRAVLHALDVNGKSQTLDVPRVTTVNNREAKIRIGEDYMYYEEYQSPNVSQGYTVTGLPIAQSASNTIVYPLGTPKTVELGKSLTVTPSVGADMRSVTLKLEPEIKAHTGDTAFPNGITLPTFTTSKITTEVIVQSGETVVMGGLITASESKTRSSVPILGSIPLIGTLFRSDSTEEKKQNLLIFVTATILSERGETMIPVNE